MSSFSLSSKPHARVRRLPAYGRELLEIRKRGLVPDAPCVAVLLDTWAYAKLYPRVVIPADVEIADLDFSFLAGLDSVLILDADAEKSSGRKCAAIREILCCNPGSLRVLEVGTPIRWTWIKSRSRGLELTEFE